MQVIKTDVSFKISGKPVAFSIYHNMPDVFGQSFDCAFENWLYRTDVYTAENLCSYIKSKQDVIAMTQEEFFDFK